MTNIAETPVLTDDELAIATVGVPVAGETMAATIEAAPNMVGIYDPPPGVSFAEHRRSIHFGVPTVVESAEDLSIGSVPIRRFTPSSGRHKGHYLHLHGGGWCLGSHTGQDSRLQAIADASGLVVSSVGYRLAPEHPFPACTDDALTAARAILAEPGFHAIGGESAGAHLSVLTMLAVRDQAIGQFDAAMLTFGAYDLSAPRLRRPVEMLLPDADEADLRQPTISPLFADLSGLPPARIVVGTRDHLLPQNLALHERWPDDSRNELDVVAGAAHAFTTLPIAVSGVVAERERDFLTR